MTVADATIDPTRDLVLERHVEVPPELVWAAWTVPAHVKRWFAPRPYETVECEIDLRPGGIFRTVMRSPEGAVMDDDAGGCVLEVVEHRRLVWTSAMAPGFRPADTPLPFTAIIELTPAGTGTAYRAIAIHRDVDGRSEHEGMGFHDGWGTALDQLVEVARTL